MDSDILELKNQLHEISMEIEREIDISSCDDSVKNMVYSAIKPYQHMFTCVIDYLEKLHK